MTVRPLFACAAALLMTACGSGPSLQSRLTTGDFLGIVTPYRIDIVQGNVVTKEQAALVKPGMTRSQVRDVLGSPMLTDVFHADRWDYIFTIRRQGTESQRRSVVVTFTDDVVKTIVAPDLPGEREFVATIAKPSSAKAPKLELSDAERAALPKPAPRAEAAPEAVGPTRTYPPLEPA
jgi:outer membrane protein assembly factor BamE